MQVEYLVTVVIEGKIGRPLREDAGGQFDAWGRSNRLGAEAVHIERNGRTVRRVRGEGDHLAVKVGQAVENLVARDGVGRWGAADRDSTGDVIAKFRRRGHHRTGGIVDARRRLAFL